MQNVVHVYTHRERERERERESNTSNNTHIMEQILIKHAVWVCVCVCVCVWVCVWWSHRTISSAVTGLKEPLYYDLFLLYWLKMLPGLNAGQFQIKMSQLWRTNKQLIINDIKVFSWLIMLHCALNLPSLGSNGVNVSVFVGYCIYSCIGHTWYHKIAVKSKCVLYMGQTKREGNIWHKLGGNTIILFFNINNDYMNNTQNHHDYLIRCSN